MGRCGSYSPGSIICHSAGAGYVFPVRPVCSVFPYLIIEKQGIRLNMIQICVFGNPSIVWGLNQKKEYCTLNRDVVV
jgi:hypothetical protein